MPKKKYENEKYKVKSTKISAFADQQVNKICERKGLNVYTITQMMFDTIIRYMDDKHNLTPEMEQAMSLFEHLEGWQNALNFADPTVKMEVGEAIYFLQDENHKKTGTRAVLVERPWMGQWMQCENIQMILERVISLMLPERYMRLKRLATDMDCTWLLEMIDRLIDTHGNEADIQAMRKEFEDANRSEYGRKPVDSPYRRKHHRDINTLFKDEKK